MDFIIIQGIGFVGSFINLYTFQINRRKRILTLQTFVNIIFALQYLFLHSTNSAIMCMIGGVRNIAFFYDNKYSENIKNIMLAAFMVVILISTYINWIGILSLLGCLGAIVATIAVWFRNEKYIRIASLLATIIWLAHDIIIGSYAAIIDGIFLMISIMVGIYRFDVKKNVKMRKTAMIHIEKNPV